MTDFSLPLMNNNIAESDLAELISFLQTNPRLTQSEKVIEFEKQWSQWLGVKYSVFVNSGASANLITLSALRETVGVGEVIVPPLTWVSDIASVLQTGMKPVFCEINPHTLGMDDESIINAITDSTKAVFLTHILGFNALTDKLIDALDVKGIPLIEDVCESHGATFKQKKLGAWGFASNFSFYYAHHMSTIEGGMVCTNDKDFYQKIRMFRSHGMIREMNDPAEISRVASENPDLSPDFIFAFPAFNVRSTEINAVIGLSQLRRLDSNNEQRTENFAVFLEHIDSKYFKTDFCVEGSSNYAFTIVLNDADIELRNTIEYVLRSNAIEFRRGLSGGGNQLRQPYLRKLMGDAYKDFPVTEHITDFSWYVGNYPGLETQKIIQLCKILNETARGHYRD